MTEAQDQDHIDQPQPNEPLTFRGREAPTIADQFAVYDRAGNELRSRLQLERIRLIAAFDENRIRYIEGVRRDLQAMQDQHDEALRKHDLMAKRMGL